MSFVSIMLFLIVEMFPLTILKLFGITDPQLLSIASIPVRCSGFILFTYTIIQINVLRFSIIGKDNKFMVFSVAIFSIPPIIILIGGLLFKDLFWYFFILGIIGNFLLLIVVNQHFNLDSAKLTEWNYHHLDLSIKYDMSALSESMIAIDQFLDQQMNNNFNKDNIHHVIEEFFYNIIKHVPGKLEKHNFDIRLIKLATSVELIVKDAGRPFNPIMTFEKDAVETFEENGKMMLSLRFLNHYSENFEYQYCNGLNISRMVMTVSE